MREERRGEEKRREERREKGVFVFVFDQTTPSSLIEFRVVFHAPA